MQNFVSNYHEVVLGCRLCHNNLEREENEICDITATWLCINPSSYVHPRAATYHYHFYWINRKNTWAPQRSAFDSQCVMKGVQACHGSSRVGPKKVGSLGLNNRCFSYGNWRDVGECKVRNQVLLRYSPGNKLSTYWSAQSKIEVFELK